MKIEVVIPEEYMGDVMGNLTARRGRIEGMAARGNGQVIRAIGAAKRNVWLCDRPAQHYAGTWRIHHAVLSL